MIKTNERSNNTIRLLLTNAGRGLIPNTLPVRTRTPPSPLPHPCPQVGNSNHSNLKVHPHWAKYLKIFRGVFSFQTIYPSKHPGVDLPLKRSLALIKTPKAS
jgi:hypothetical protein